MERRESALYKDVAVIDMLINNLLFNTDEALSVWCNVWLSCLVARVGEKMTRWKFLNSYSFNFINTTHSMQAQLGLVTSPCRISDQYTSFYIN